MAAVTDTSKGLITKQFSVLTMGLFLELDVTKKTGGGSVADAAAKGSFGYEVVPFTEKKCSKWDRKECAEIFNFGMSEVHRLNTPTAYMNVTRHFVCSQKFISRDQPEHTDSTNANDNSSQQYAAPIFNGCKLASRIAYVKEVDTTYYSHLDTALGASTNIVNMTTLMIAVNDVLCLPNANSSWEASVKLLKDRLELLPDAVKKEIGAVNASKHNEYLYCMYVLQRLSNARISLYVRSTNDPNSRLLGLVFSWCRLSILQPATNNTQDDFLLSWCPGEQQDNSKNAKNTQIPQNVTCGIYESSSIDFESILKSSLIPDLKLKYPDAISW